MDNDFNITAETAPRFIKKRHEIAFVRNALIGILQTALFLNDQPFWLMMASAYVLGEISRRGDRMAESTTKGTYYYGVFCVDDGKAFIQKQMGFSIAVSGVVAYTLNLLTP